MSMLPFIATVTFSTLAMLGSLFIFALKVQAQFLEVKNDLKHVVKQVDEIKENVKEVDGEVRQTQHRVAYLDAWLAKGAPPNGVSTR